MESGIPYRVVLSERLPETGKVEILERKTGEKQEVEIKKVKELLKK